MTHTHTHPPHFFPCKTISQQTQMLLRSLMRRMTWFWAGMSEDISCLSAKLQMRQMFAIIAHYWSASFSSSLPTRSKRQSCITFSWWVLRRVISWISSCDESYFSCLAWQGISLLKSEWRRLALAEWLNWAMFGRCLSCFALICWC